MTKNGFESPPPWKQLDHHVPPKKTLKWHKATVKQPEHLNFHLQAVTLEGIHHFWSLINDCEWHCVQPAPKRALTFSTFCLAGTTLNNYFSGFEAQLGICCAAGGQGPVEHHWAIRDGLCMSRG